MSCIPVAAQENLDAKHNVQAPTELNLKTIQIGSLTFSPCKLTDADQLLQKKAECARLSVPEDYDNPQGKSLDLFIARFKSHSPKPKLDALTFLAGGPGQAASEGFLHWNNLFSKILKQRDIYLIDQRGTGKSNKLSCPTPEDQLHHFDPVQIKKLSQECVQQLAGNSRFYTTSIAVKDLDQIRIALGLVEWNLYGGSYGTRVALHYLRRYPDATRTVVIDAVAYPELNLGPAIALESQRALEQMISRCKNVSDCNTQFPDLEQGVQRLIAALKKQSQPISIENFSTGKTQKINFTIYYLGAVIRLLLYSPASVSILPVMLHEAYSNNNYAPLARQSLAMMNSMNNVISTGMHNSVVCTEDAPYFAKAEIDKTKLSKSYLGDVLLETIQATCEVWPVGVIDSDFKEPVISDKPVLLLSGSADPITPPEYAEMAAKSLSNSRHIIMADQGHILANSACIPILMTKFIDMASHADINTECLDKQKPEPFFIDFNGPSP